MMVMLTRKKNHPLQSFQKTNSIKKKTQSFQDGKNEGIAEATEKEKQSREAFVSRALSDISTAAQALFTEEQNRIDLYEAQALELSINIFERLFPVFEEALGFENLKHHLRTVLEKHKKHQPLIFMFLKIMSPAFKISLTTLFKKSIAGFLTYTRITLWIRIHAV